MAKSTENIADTGDKLELKEKLNSLPSKPGVYLHKNKNDSIIYVGKAKNLRSRVRSYFQKGGPADAKTIAMVKKIADFDYIMVDSEAEALILEDTLVKKYKPRYNVLLRDDKSYPYVRVTSEKYPRIFATRTVVRDGSKYFGPFTNVGSLKRTLRLVRKIFMIRTCKYNLTDEAVRTKKYKLCLDYHIEKCEGPCEGLISKEEYNRKVKQAAQILNGKTKEVEKQLREEMERLSGEMKFEEAARSRDRYLLLKEYQAKQKIVTADLVDRDVFGFGREESSACVLIFKIRDGKMVGKRHYIVPNAEKDSDESILQTSVEKWFLESDFAPKEIFLPSEPSDKEFIEKWLREKRDGAVKITVPQRGEKRKLVEMAAKNAEYILKDYHLALAKREQAVPRSVQALKRDLNLQKLPRRIECFDNSHMQGSELVASCVVFADGKPKKSDYRKFKIRDVHKNDDFAAMKEAVGRRYKRVIDERGEFPDLIVIDGGKGQLSAADAALTELGIESKISIIGLAKRLDEVFIKGKKDSILLPKTSSALKLIQRIRDEAHRFAITYHKKLRDKRTFQTELTKIPGIGEKRAQKLLVELGSSDKVKNADYETLKAIVGEKAANSITQYFENK